MQSVTRALAVAAVLAAATRAQLDVAICAAADLSSGACQYSDVQAKLLATDRFETVDVINVTSMGSGTPTLAQLQAYDALICWTNATPADNNAWGNVLADYVDAGGGVVVAVFANSTATAGRNIGGRWQTSYEVILDQSGTASGSAALGSVDLPGHPVMAGVASFAGGNSYRPLGTALAAGARRIAAWTDGAVLVAEGATPRRIDLGFYPPSSGCSGTFWDATTDGGLLMANALEYVARGVACTGSAESYCTSSTTSNGCHPTLNASGSPSAGATSGFNITCSAVEGQKSGLMFYGVDGPNAVAWAAGSSSTLCVKPPTQRTTTQNSGGTFGACDGALSIDFLAFLAANPGAVGAPAAPGQQFHVQAWFRDPSAVKTTNLSDGLTFTLCP